MRNTLLRATLVGVSIWLTLGGWARAATNSGDGFAIGNTEYAAGKFAEAVSAYESQVSRGAYSANLFYNLGDAYYRQGNRGRAILNYQRALLLDPAHAEAAANLAFMRGIRNATVSASAAFTTTALSWLTAASGWLAVAGLVIGLSGRRRRGVGLALGAVGLLVGVAGAITIRSLDGGADPTARAVIVADSVPARYAPADNSKVVTNLTAGGEVRVLSDQGAWMYALLPDGTRAWLASDKIELVVPPVVLPGRDGSPSRP